MGSAAAILLAAALLRVWAVHALSADPRIQEPVLDGAQYLNLARTLSQGGGWPPGPIFMTPFYPFVLSLLFRMFAPVVLTAQVFQSLVGLGTLILLAAAVRRDVGTEAAWIAASLYALCGPILAMENQFLTESVLLFLATAALWFWPHPGRRRWTAFAFGIVSGLLVTGRGVLLLIPLVALVQTGLRARKGSGWPGWLKRAGLVVAGGLVALLPVIAHQTRATGHLSFLTANGGLNLYIGNNPNARGIYSLPQGVDLQTDFTGLRSASVLAGRDLTLEESSRLWTQKALDFMRGSPARAAGLFLRKALYYLSPNEIPQIEDFQILRESTWPLRLAFIDFRWLLPLALLGLSALVPWRGASPAGPGTRDASPAGPGTGRSGSSDSGAAAPRRSTPRPRLSDSGTAGSRLRQFDSGAAGSMRMAPWLLLIGVGWVSTILFFANDRFRIPFYSGFLGLAALGGTFLIRTVRLRRLSPALLILPATVGLQLLIPGYNLQEARSYDVYKRALRLGRAHQSEAALAAYRESARLWPKAGEAWQGIGMALVQLGRPSEAIEPFRQAAALMPANPLTHATLGAAYAELNQWPEALPEFETAVRLDPMDPRMRSDYGLALAHTGRKDDGIAQLREVLQRSPDFVYARKNLEALGGTP